MSPIIGQDKDALLAVLAQAGLTDISQIQPLADGLSNHNYHIETPTAHYVLRENADAADSFHDYLYLRDNPAGLHRELWYHEQGDRSWLVVTRNTLTHEITQVELARDVARARGRGR